MNHAVTVGRVIVFRNRRQPSHSRTKALSTGLMRCNTLDSMPDLGGPQGFGETYLLSFALLEEEADIEGLFAAECFRRENSKNLPLRPQRVHTGTKSSSNFRMPFDWLVVGQVLPFNPASSVRGPKHIVKNGKMPVLSVEEAMGASRRIRPHSSNSDATWRKSKLADRDLHS